MSQRHWDRVRQITKTPPATPVVARVMLSPEPSTPRVQPTSILKSNKRESRLKSTAKKGRLQFDDTLSEVRSIPNRFEQRAQQPDHFTMDDSVASETEIALGEPMDCYEEEPQELDTGISPMILNLDEDTEEIPVSAEDFLKDEVSAESNEEIVEEEIPAAEETTVSEEENVDVEMEQPVEKPKVLERSIEYQSEEDVEPTIVERSIEYQSEEDVVSDHEEATPVEKASPKPATPEKKQTSPKAAAMEVPKTSPRATRSETVSDVVSGKEDSHDSGNLNIAQSSESIVEEERTRKDSDDTVTSQDATLSTTTRNWLAAVKRPTRASRRLTVVEETSKRTTRASSVSSNHESDEPSAVSPPKKSNRGRKSPARNITKILESSNNELNSTSLNENNEEHDVTKSPAKGTRRGRRASSVLSSQESSDVPSTNAQRQTRSQKSPAKVAHNLRNANKSKGQEVDNLSPVKELEEESGKAPASPSRSTRRNARGSKSQETVTRSPSKEPEVPKSPGKSARKTRGSKSQENVTHSPSKEPEEVPKSPGKSTRRTRESKSQESIARSPSKEADVPKSPGKGARRNARESKSQESVAHSPAKEIGEEPSQIYKSPAKSGRRNARESNITSSQESEDPANLTASPRRSTRLQRIQSTPRN